MVRKKDFPIKWEMTVRGGADRSVCFLLLFSIYLTYGGSHAKYTP
jgi:hypothetical protein